MSEVEIHLTKEDCRKGPIRLAKTYNRSLPLVIIDYVLTWGIVWILAKYKRKGFSNEVVSGVTSITLKSIYETESSESDD